jgi:DNA polymerase III subunit epsilon
VETILILDTETTGTDDNATAIEVACILYSVAYAAPIRSFASLIRASSNPAEPVNRIPAALLTSAPEPAQVWERVRAMAFHADAIVAHNADFDRRFAGPEMNPHKPWICSMDDLQWPQAGTGNSLVALALAHGVGVASAHRAMADCDLLARLFTRVAEMGTDLGAMLARGLRPKATYQALVSYESNHLAKSAGFRWDAGKRMWARKMAIEDAAALPFKVREIVDA